MATEEPVHFIRSGELRHAMEKRQRHIYVLCGVSNVCGTLRLAMKWRNVTCKDCLRHKPHGQPVDTKE